MSRLSTKQRRAARRRREKYGVVFFEYLPPREWTGLLGWRMKMLAQPVVFTVKGLET